MAVHGRLRPIRGPGTVVGVVPAGEVRPVAGVHKAVLFKRYLEKLGKVIDKTQKEKK